MSPNFERVFQHYPLERIFLELTEHMAISDYEHFMSVLKPLRDRGLRIAIDDAGAGYSSFRHILRLQPDVIKLDTSLTQNIDSDHSRRALASAFISFANATNSLVVAEGVETEQQLSTLKELGVGMIQGYLLGRPMPLSEAALLVKQTH